MKLKPKFKAEIIKNDGGGITFFILRRFLFFWYIRASHKQHKEFMEIMNEEPF